MFSAEIISMFLSGAAGFLFKLIANAQKDSQDKFEMYMKAAQQADDSADRAEKREQNSAGQITRRIIVILVLFSIVIAPFILTLIGKPTVVEVTSPIKSWLAGLFHVGGHTKFYSFDGYLISQEIKIATLSLISFYFGSASAKR